jgi:hypothetical protein
LKSHAYFITSPQPTREPVFEQAHHVARSEQHDEVHDGNRGVHLHGPKRDAVDLHRLVEKLSVCERRGQRRRLRELERTLDKWGHHAPQRLRQDDPAKRDVITHAERLGAFPLTALDRDDAATKHFRVKGTGLRRQREHRGRVRLEESPCSQESGSRKQSVA